MAIVRNFVPQELYLVLGKSFSTSVGSFYLFVSELVLNIFCRCAGRPSEPKAAIDRNCVPYELYLVRGKCFSSSVGSTDSSYQHFINYFQILLRFFF